MVRFRPPVTEEESQDAHAFVVHPNGHIVETVDGAFSFDLDHAFSQTASQAAVYDYIGRPIIDDVLDGYNGTIFAYGQTGGGKTHSMMGPHGADDSQEGVVPRAAQQIFDNLVNANAEFTIRCSFMEVYREQMRDLLCPHASQKLRVKELPQRGLFVDGLSREYVTSKAEVMSILRAGNRSRVVAQTKLNAASSRSHAIFVIYVEQRCPDGTEKLGKLALVDLAGSEKVSKSECVGETLEEAKKINWSLTALGKVIDSLAEQRPHVPYRDSRLTRVLEEALGGNCRTTLLVAASPFAQHYDESLSSLRFATRAKKVRNHAKVNYMYSSDQLLLLVAQLQRDLAHAQKQISVGKVPAAGAHGAARFRGKQGQDCPRRSKRAPPTSGEDVDEMSGPGQGSRFHSVGSPEAYVGSTSGESDTAEGSEESDERHREDEVWKPLAVAARDAIWSMEAALTSQERALDEAQLLRARRDGADLQTIQGDAFNSSKGGADALTERFRALRHAVDARGLQWRLQLEKHKTESLSLELEMRKRYSEELERSLEEATSRLTEAIQDNPESHSWSRSTTGASKASGVAAGGGSSGGLGDAMRRMPNGRKGGTGGEPGFARPTASSAASASTGRRPPAPRKAAVAGGASGGGATGNSARPPLANRMAGHSTGSGGSIEARPASPGAHPGYPGFHPMLRMASADVAGGCECVVGTTDVLGEDACWPPTAGTGESTGSGVVLSAGSGSVADRRGGVVLAALTAATAVEQQQRDLRSELHGSCAREAAAAARVEAMQSANNALEVQVLRQRGEMARCTERLAELAIELGARDVKVAALRHEVHVKDTLLKKLGEEVPWRGDGDELELLIEQAMSPLAAILTREQMATASAAAERCVAVAFPGDAAPRGQLPQWKASTL